jgi:hypothetical protein
MRLVPTRAMCGEPSAAGIGHVRKPHFGAGIDVFSVLVTHRSRARVHAWPPRDSLPMDLDAWRARRIAVERRYPMADVRP